MTLWYWNSSNWSQVSELDLAALAPTIVCRRLQGDGALDPKIRIAVSDGASMEVAQVQHRRYRRGGKR